MRSALVELLNTLGAILRNVDLSDSERKSLLRLQAVLSAMLDMVLREALQKNTAKYKSAVKKTREATDAAKGALRDMESIEKTIKKVTAAAKAIDKVIQLVAGVML